MLLMTAMAGGAATTASWDFENDIPAGIRESTNYQGVEADIESDVAGIFMPATRSPRRSKRFTISPISWRCTQLGFSNTSVFSIIVLF